MLSALGHNVRAFAPVAVNDGRVIPPGLDLLVVPVAKAVIGAVAARPRRRRCRKTSCVGSWVVTRSASGWLAAGTTARRAWSAGLDRASWPTISGRSAGPWPPAALPNPA